MDADDQRALLGAAPAAFARRLLRSLGLPDDPLHPASSWVNRVWLAPAHVVRVSSGHFRDAYVHERAVLALLPDAVPHSAVVAHGSVGEREWLVQERAAGVPLMEAWPTMTTTRRRDAITALAYALRALHAVPLPCGFRNPWLERAFAPDGPVGNAYHAPPSQYRRLLDAAANVPGTDRVTLDAVEAFIEDRLDAFDDGQPSLVHGDVHFANVMWDGAQLTALLDWEGARPASSDMELDTLLRFLREPHLFRGREHPDVPAPRTVRAVPRWLADGYPELFSHPRLTARLEVYDALWQLVQLQHFPPRTGPPDPWGHLRASCGRG